LNYYTIAKPGDRVRLVSIDGSGPTVEGYVSEATYTYLTIRGLGFTQFHAGQYQIDPGCSADGTAPQKRPEQLAQEALLDLLNDPDPGVRFQAARELIDGSHRF